MKRIIICLLLCVSVLSVWGETRPLKQGVWSCDLRLQTGTRRAFSIGAGVQYIPVNRLRADLNANYYFSINYDFNLNLHYLINVSGERFYVYPLVGFTVANMDAADGDKVAFPRETHAGANFGAGMEYLIDYDLSVMFEGRYAAMKNIGHAAFAAGLRLKF